MAVLSSVELCGRVGVWTCGCEEELKAGAGLLDVFRLK